jgi:serine/threonine-protein kinase
MEYIRGECFSKLLRAARRKNLEPSLNVVGRIIHGLLHGLHAAHTLHDDQGHPLHVVHRDVSPQNVHVGADGLARVLDFGVAKAASRRHVTQGGEIKGKLAYMSGEQVTGEEVDHRTDVYAAGVVLWETLTQRRLITGGHEGEMLHKVLTANFAPPGITPAVDAVVMKALSAKKEDRFATADEMAHALALAEPPAPRHAIAALVRELAATELESRTAKLRSAPEANVIAEILTDHATVTRAATVSSKTPLMPTTPGRSRSAIPLVVGGGVLVSGAIIAAFVVGTRMTRSAPPAATAAPPPETSSMMVAEPAPAVSSAPAPVISSAPPVVSSAPPAPKPPKKPVAPKKPDCRVPYTVDANGDRHYRPECVE